MLRAYKYRIYPTEEQKVLFAKTFGCVRYVYNWGIDIKSKLYKENKENIGAIALINRMVSELKPENEWLKEVNAQSLQMSLRNLDTAYKNFFKKNGRYPTFKSKHDRQSFHNPQHCSVNFNPMQLLYLGLMKWGLFWIIFVEKHKTLLQVRQFFC